jgi:hypothetical protein
MRTSSAALVVPMAWRAGAETGVAQDLHHGAAILAANLQHGAEFLVEQRGEHAVAQAARRSAENARCHRHRSSAGRSRARRD